MPETPDTMDGSDSMIHWRVGPGLVEISALSALIGSQTAASLSLGDRGAAGPPWAAMSMFGSLSIIQACAAAAVPCWLRESLGVRSSATDMSVGMTLDLSIKNKARDVTIRKNQPEAIGIICERRTTIHGPSYDVYAFDRSTSLTIENLPACRPGDDVHINVFRRDPYYRDPIITRDWISLLVSLVKVIEVTILWTANGRTVCWVTSCPWLYFFTCAVILQQQRLSRGYVEESERTQVDIIGGKLPTSRKAGEERKILLQAPQNFRHHILWKMTWAGGCLISTSSLVAVNVLLAMQEIQVLYIWLGFQVLWLIARSAYFHLSQEDRAMTNALLTQVTLQTMSQDARRRVLDLILALSTYQVHSHARGTYSYEDDLSISKDLEVLSPLIRQCLQPHVDITLLGRDASITDVSFVAVIGDTLLSSASWLYGSKATGMDLYDSCIVIIRIAGTSLAIPSARVICVKSRDWSTVEEGQLPLNPPRGTFRWGPDTVKWVYWIPCSDGRWLQACTEKLSIKGTRKSELRTDDEITEQLSKGIINVSHRHVDGIKEVVELSKTAANILQKFLGVS